MEKQVSIIQAEYRISRKGMISGFAEAASHTYEKRADSSGTIWLFDLECDDPGGSIYCHNLRDLHSRGFGGATLQFKLKDGSTYTAKGPWHSNSAALYSRTGVDLRDKHLTCGAISLEREWLDNETILKKMLWIGEPSLGLFSKIEKLAQEFANELNQTVFYYSESHGGSSCGSVSPKR